MKLFTTLLILFSASSWAQDLRTVLSGKDILIPKLGSKEALPTHVRFNSFIKNSFNKPGPFHGPNCYNTALIASGYTDTKGIRYVSPEEFEEILKVAFRPVPTPSYKDVIVFDAKASRGHAGFYLGDNLIFHKKSYGTHYHYRITTIENAGVVEENEWTPGIMDDSSLQMKWPELGKLPQNYYRLQSKVKPQLDPKLAPLILKMEAALLTDLGKWAIARKWGMSGEYFLEDLIQYAKQIKANAYTVAVLTSLKDQVYIMLEEVNFKNARNPSKVMSELCIPEDKEQLVEFFTLFGKLHKKNPERVFEILKDTLEQDPVKCSNRPLFKLLAL